MSVNSPMEPVDPPTLVRKLRPDTSQQRIGAPPGVSEEDCGAVTALVGLFDPGIPGVADYFKPTREQLELLNAGGVIEFVQFTHRMAMHAVNVWPSESTD